MIITHLKLSKKTLGCSDSVTELWQSWMATCELTWVSFTNSCGWERMGAESCVTGGRCAISTSFILLWLSSLWPSIQTPSHHFIWARYSPGSFKSLSATQRDVLHSKYPLMNSSWADPDACDQVCLTFPYLTRFLWHDILWHEEKT